MRTQTPGFPHPARRWPIQVMERKLDRLCDRRPYGACLLALVVLPALVLIAVAAAAALVALPLSWLYG
jgi:hypothetical protein